jgi:DNA-binding NarL/FixJ family response regulator
MMNAPKFDVLVADAQPLARAGLVHAINSHPHLKVCAETGCGIMARDLCTRMSPAVLVLDPALGQGLAMVRDLTRFSAATRVVIVTGDADAMSVQRAFKSGACGYVTRLDPVPAVLTAIAGAAKGQRHIGPCAEQILLGSLACGGMECRGSEVSALSEREFQIFRLIGAGHGTRAMAEELRLSVKTVETHRQRIKEKLGLATGAELQRRAVLFQIPPDQS